MQMITVASKLDWGGWLRGLVGAFISGGAGAIGATTGVAAFDPSHDIAGVRMFEVMCTAFFFSGLISLGKFLQTHSVPDAKP